MLVANKVAGGGEGFKIDDYKPKWLGGSIELMLDHGKFALTSKSRRDALCRILSHAQIIKNQTDITV